jgi:hypothetical protein
MARDYNGTSGRSSQTYAGLTSVPIAIFARVMADSQALTSVPIAMSKASVADATYLAIFRGATTDKVDFRASNNVTNRTVVSSASYVAGTWHSVMIVLNGTALIQLWLDGVPVSDGVSHTYPGGQQPDTFSVAAFASNSAFGSFHDGKVCNFAVWHGYPNDWDAGEVVALHKGFSPKRVRPRYLKAYWPMVRSVQDMRDVFGAITEAGSPAPFDHPPSYGGF